MNTAEIRAKVYAETREQREAEACVDRDLVARVQSGDVRAFDELTTKYRERLYSVVYNMIPNREDAADLTQDAFIKAFRSISKFKGKSSFFTWIYRIAVNTTITHIKKNRLRQFLSFETIQEDGAESELIEKLSSQQGTEKPTFLKELQEKLNEALQTLSIKHRTVVILYEIEGLSHQEIAEIVGCSEGTVRSRLHYAKQQLQAQLKQYIS